jgi:hypothetical protein
VSRKARVAADFCQTPSIGDEYDATDCSLKARRGKRRKGRIVNLGQGATVAFRPCVGCDARYGYLLALPAFLHGPTRLPCIA